MMTAEKIYLICFLVGFLLSLLSIAMHSLDFHIPEEPSHLPDHGGDHGFTKCNFTTVSAFLAWFGGAGYLLERYSGFGLLLALLLAIVTGLTGASIVFVLIAKVLLKNERSLNPADFDMIGVLGRVSSPVRENGGVGEMIYTRHETRRAAPIRAEDGLLAIDRNIEVVVTRYEKGIAYVRRWDELSGGLE